MDINEYRTKIIVAAYQMSEKTAHLYKECEGWKLIIDDHSLQLSHHNKRILWVVDKNPVLDESINLSNRLPKFVSDWMKFD
ncbi:TPA: hypothetical protein NJY08_005050 [Salmonella enterica subsp. enterica serovar Typhi str. AG3]|nr:hypothetical protein [Salmonella enterica subsp. enterica serovar Typhi str. AG3]